MPQFALFAVQILENSESQVFGLLSVKQEESQSGLAHENDQINKFLQKTRERFIKTYFFNFSVIIRAKILCLLFCNRLDQI